MNEEISKRRQELGNDLSKDISGARRLAQRHHLASVTLMIIALVCSAAAVIVGLITDRGKIAGLLALLPPLIAFGVSNLKLDGKACWYFNRVNALEALQYRLRYQLPMEPTADNIAAIAEARSRLVDTMEKAWDKQLVLDWSALSKPAHDMGYSASATQSSQ